MGEEGVEGFLRKHVTTSGTASEDEYHDIALFGEFVSKTGKRGKRINLLQIGQIIQAETWTNGMEKASSRVLP